jgi:hypothetical protein
MSEASLIILSGHFLRHRLLNMPNLNPWLPHRNFISTLKMDLLLNSDGSLVCKGLIFKYCKISASTHLITFCTTLTECQFLQSSSLRLRIEEVDGANFNTNHDDIHDEIFPPSPVHPNRIDVVGEETCASDKELFD